MKKFKCFDGAEIPLCGVFLFAFLMSCGNSDIDLPEDLSSGSAEQSSSSADTQSSSSEGSSSSADTQQSSSSEESSSSADTQSSSSEVSSSSSADTQSSDSGSEVSSSSGTEISSSSLETCPATTYNPPNTFVDSRDGRRYYFAEAKGKKWMLQNLNYSAGETKGMCQGATTLDGNSEMASCNTYGRYYNWAQGMNLPNKCNTTSAASDPECEVQSEHQGLCPSGWHLPSEDEWALFEGEELHSNLLTIRGGNYSASDGWKDKGKIAFFAIAEEGTSANERSVIIWKVNEPTFEMTDPNNYSRVALKSELFNIRCVANSTTAFPVETPPPAIDNAAEGTITDCRDGQTYPYKKIGDLTWLLKNMNYGGYINTCYNSIESNCETYGKLYRFENAGSVCPAGWHLPSADEWGALAVYTAASLRNEEWGTSTNGTGFNALPGGMADVGVNGFFFTALGEGAEWWIDGATPTISHILTTATSIGTFTKNTYTEFKSIRCVRD